MDIYFEKVNELIADKQEFVSVIIVETSGSVPQDTGSKMLITNSGLYYGTIGGGKVEKRAIDESLNLLEKKDPLKITHFVHWNLRKDIGMTCGGSVKLYFELHNFSFWNIIVFGAGHVANALISILIKLNCQITCIDNRQEWLSRLPLSSNLKIICLDNMSDFVQNIPNNSFIILTTMGHSTDLAILLELLSKEFTASYLGVIGSKAKAQILKKELAENNISEEKIKNIHCPIGLNIGTNHPQEIAISIAAQLIQIRSEKINFINK